MKLFNNYFSDLIQAAKAGGPNEVVGFLYKDGQGSLTYKPVLNQRSGSEFEVSDKDQHAARKAGAFAFFHSHTPACMYDGEFSPMDLQYAQLTGMRWLLFSCKTETFNYVYFGKPAPLLGREFVMGLQDCIQLVADYLLLCGGFHMKFFVRSPYVMQSGYSLTPSLMADLGFERVDDKPRPHDVLFFAMGTGAPTHAGVMLRDNRLLHHLRSMPSAAENYTETWQRLTRWVYRHPNFTSKVPLL